MLHYPYFTFDAVLPESEPEPIGRYMYCILPLFGLVLLTKVSLI